jgi:hypothetical protein
MNPCNGANASILAGSEKAMSCRHSLPGSVACWGIGGGGGGIGVKFWPSNVRPFSAVATGVTVTSSVIGFEGLGREAGQAPFKAAF